MNEQINQHVKHIMPWFVAYHMLQHLVSVMWYVRTYHMWYAFLQTVKAKKKYFVLYFVFE